jgi:uncharacterized protein (TIGR03067 family)
MRAFLITGCILLGSGLQALSQPPYYPQPYPQYPYRQQPNYNRVNPHQPPGDYNRWGNGANEWQAAIQREQDRLQGTYGLVAVEQNGQRTAGWDPNDQLIVRGDRFFRVTNGQQNLSGTIRVVDPNGRFKKMILTADQGSGAGTPLPTLYTLEGNTFRDAFYTTGNVGQFPWRLETQPGDGKVLNVWQRVGQ